MRNKPVKYLITITLLLFLAATYHYENTEPSSETYEVQASGPIILSDRRIQHILYGDGRSGGHKHGVGTPCKSEFPADWDDEKILSTTKKIAANDNLNWEQQDNGYFVAEQMEEDIRVRVVLGQEKRRVITSYPTNVQRNPCEPRNPANDN